jgi:hypothetical protein
MAGTIAIVALLTREMLQQFHDNGYIVLRDLVSEALLVEADREIDAVAAGPMPPHEGDGGPGVNTWFLPHATLPAAEAALRASSGLEAARELVAPDTVDLAFDDIQISTTKSPWRHTPGGPHIDGHGTGDIIDSFTLLAGILLTDQTRAQSGNLWVWPGSHFVHAHLFGERAVDVLTASLGHSTWPERLVDLASPEPILGHRGDVVLAHYLLGHNKGGNVRPFVRRTLYYRLATPQHRQRWRETFLDPWTEYPPIHALRPSREPSLVPTRTTVDLRIGDESA